MIVCVSNLCIVNSSVCLHSHDHSYICVFIFLRRCVCIGASYETPLRSRGDPASFLCLVFAIVALLLWFVLCILWMGFQMCYIMGNIWSDPVSCCKFIFSYIVKNRPGLWLGFVQFNAHCWLAVYFLIKNFNFGFTYFMIFSKLMTNNWYLAIPLFTEMLVIETQLLFLGE